MQILVVDKDSDPHPGALGRQFANQISGSCLSTLFGHGVFASGSSLILTLLENSAVISAVEAV